MLSKYVNEFFESTAFKSSTLSQSLSSKAKAEIQASLAQAFPLSKESSSQILSKIHSKNAIPVVILTGTESHAISIVLYKDQLIVCNRGVGRKNSIEKDKNITTFYSLPFSDITETTIEQLIKIHSNIEAFSEIYKDLPVQDGFTQKDQGIGNCAWANGKGAVGIVCRLYAGFANGKKIYKAFTAFLREKVLQEYLEQSEDKDLAILLEIHRKYIHEKPSIYFPEELLHHLEVEIGIRP